MPVKARLIDLKLGTWTLEDTGILVYFSQCLACRYQPIQRSVARARGE